MIPRLWASLRAARKFSGYRPQKVTLRLVWRWQGQFERRDRKLLRKLLSHVIYFSEQRVVQVLIQRNSELLDELKNAGFDEHQIIYVSIDDAGSSSPVILNLLRDFGRLQKRDFQLIDSKNVLDLNKATSVLGEGVIIYVDDFSGTGDQFEGTRRFVAQYIVGNFAQFFLAPSICEEAQEALESVGVQAKYSHLHTRAERPLLDESGLLESRHRKRLVELSYKVDGGNGLGYGDLASMVIGYLNAPDSTPPILRGSNDQKPYFGVLPRTTDLPAK